MNVKLKALIAAIKPLAFAAAGWKMDAEGHIELKDGNPIWVDASGTDITMEGGTISRLNSEAKALRIRAETAETTARSFEGIDPKKAKEALELVTKIDQKKLVDAGEIDKLHDQFKQAHAAKEAEDKKAYEELQTKYHNSQLSAAFSQSKLISERVSIPLEFIEAKFRDKFKFDDQLGKVVAIGADGAPIQSKTRFGELADLDEALEQFIEAHPQKDTILRAPDKSGGGNNGNGGGRGSSARTMSRAAFEALSPQAQATEAAKINTGDLVVLS